MKVALLKDEKDEGQPPTPAPAPPLRWDSPRPVGPPPKKKAKPEVPEHEKNLAVIHNLTAENLQHAHDLGGLAAPSIAVVNKDHGMNNFGEITLVAHPDLIDPQYHTPVFNADVYSPRWPRAKYRVNEKAVKQFQTWLSPYLTRNESTFHSVADWIETGGHKGVLDAHGMREVMGMAFLEEEKGRRIQPKMQIRDDDLHFQWSGMPAMQDYFKNHGMGSYIPDADVGGWLHQKLSQAVDLAIQQYSEGVAKGDSAFPARIRESLNKFFGEDDSSGAAAGLVHSNILPMLHLDHLKRHEAFIDKDATRAHINAALVGHEDEFEKWAHARTKPMEGAPYIRQGMRKLPYSMSNILKKLTSKTRNGEGHHYGLGSARSLGAKKFASIAGIQKERGQIVSIPEMTAAKKANDKRFDQLERKLKAYGPSKGFGYDTLEDLSKVIGESYKRGNYLFNELRKGGYKDVPPDLQKELADFARDLVKMPTEYFEAKPQRVVGINEFKGAVVPHDVKPEILALLAHNGIEHVEHYDRVDGNPFRQDSNRTQALARLAHAQKLLLSEEDLDLKFEPLNKGERYHVALVTAYDHEGKLLLGRRNDNQLYTLPGGHLRPGEYPRDAAQRELAEETGLQALSLSPLTVHELPNKTILHCFSALVNGIPHGEHDPDRECDEWKFVDVSNGLPKRIANKLHGPQDADSNLLLRLFNIEERPETALAKSIADTWNQAATPQQSHWGHLYMAHEQAMAPAGRPANHMGEITMPHLAHFEKAFNDHNQSSNPQKPKDVDLQGEVGYSPKVLHSIPVPGPGGKVHDVTMMVKLAHWGACAYPKNMNFFREGTFQSVLHAGKMDDIVQRSFLAPYGTGKYRVAATVIPLDKATTLARCDESKWAAYPAAVQLHWQHQARLLAMMDYVLGNDDRHSGNVMMRKMVRNGVGGVLAIDNGEALSYGKKCGFLEHMSQRNALKNLIARLPIGGPPAPGGWTKVMEHWAQNSQAMRQAFLARRHLIRNPVTRSNIEGGFEERANWLDRLAAEPRMGTDDLTWEHKAHFDYLAELRGQRPHPPRRQKWQNERLPSHSGPDSGSFSKSIGEAPVPASPNVPASPRPLTPPPTALPHPAASPASPGIANLKPGKLVSSSEHLGSFSKVHDYSHLLPPGHEDKQLLVTHTGTNSPTGVTNESMNAHLSIPKLAGGKPKDLRHILPDTVWPSERIGQVESKVLPPHAVLPPAIEPHSHLEEAHQKQDLGTSMYNAVYAHAHNEAGINEARQNRNYSEGAHRTQMKLAAIHGHDYVPVPADKTAPGYDPNYPYGSYRATFGTPQAKDEYPANVNEADLMGRGRGVTFIRR